MTSGYDEFRDAWGECGPAADADAHGAEERLSDGMLPGDTGTLPYAARCSACALLKNAYISSERNPSEWKALRSEEPAIRSLMHNLFTELVIDERNEIAYCLPASSGGDGFPHKLKQERELNDVQSLLVIYLRLSYLNQIASGALIAWVDTDDMTAYLERLFSDGVVDYAKTSRTIELAIEKMRLCGFIEPAKVAPGRWRILPVMESAFPLESIEAMLQAYRNANRGLGIVPDDLDPALDRALGQGLGQGQDPDRHHDQER